MSNPECCILYATDSKYLYPSLVSAIQARRNTSPSAADVVIFCIGLDRRTEDVFGPICERENIGLLPVSREAVEGQSAMLARFFLTRFVPEKYSQYLYLDGDVHVLGSLDPLVETEVREGQFLAVNDPMTFQLADSGPQSRDLAAHLSAIGLTPEQSMQYFNSGVMRICRDGWSTTGSEAWELYKSIAPSARFQDQDALNVVGLHKRIPISLAWNFPIFMRNSRVEESIRPRITHFMSSPKPWHGSFAPWTRAAHEPYTAMVKAYPELASFTLNMPFGRRALYQLHQRKKQLIEKVTWGLSQRRDRILSYEAACSL